LNSGHSLRPGEGGYKHLVDCQEQGNRKEKEELKRQQVKRSEIKNLFDENIDQEASAVQ
jgi:hypothetical protein